MPAAEIGLLVPYRPAYINDLHGWAVRQYAMSQNYVGGFYTSAIGFGWNTELLKKKKLLEPIVRRRLGGFYASSALKAVLDKAAE